jgi:hypothetical protein
MKLELTTSHAADLLFADKNANWTYAGARVLVEHLEQLEESAEVEIELDIVAIRCEYSQYESLESWYEEYHGYTNDNLDADDIREYIQDRGTLIEFDGGIIVSSF